MKIDIVVSCREPSKYPRSAKLGGTCGTAFRGSSLVLIMRLLNEHERDFHTERADPTPEENE